MSACPERSRPSWSSIVPTAVRAGCAGSASLYERTILSSRAASHPGPVSVTEAFRSAALRTREVTFPAWARSDRPSSSIAWPAAVSVAPFGVRSSRVAPTAFSRARIARESAGWVMDRRCAARVKLPSSATAMK